MVQRLPDVDAATAWLDQRAEFEVPQLLDTLLRAPHGAHARAVPTAARVSG